MVGECMTLNGRRYRIVAEWLASGVTSKGVEYQFMVVIREPEPGPARAFAQ